MLTKPRVGLVSEINRPLCRHIRLSSFMNKKQFGKNIKKQGTERMKIRKNKYKRTYFQVEKGPFFLSTDCLHKPEAYNPN
jgi:hypothetical protein